MRQHVRLKEAVTHMRHVSTSFELAYVIIGFFIPYKACVIPKSSILYFSFNCHMSKELNYMKHVENGHSQKGQKYVFNTNKCLLQVKIIAVCSILQFFRPLLSYHLSLRSLLCLILSGRFTQVLLYSHIILIVCQY